MDLMTCRAAIRAMILVMFLSLAGISAALGQASPPSDHSDDLLRALAIGDRVAAGACRPRGGSVTDPQGGEDAWKMADYFATRLGIKLPARPALLRPDQILGFSEHPTFKSIHKLVMDAKGEQCARYFTMGSTLVLVEAARSRLKGSEAASLALLKKTFAAYQMPPVLIEPIMRSYAGPDYPWLLATGTVSRRITYFANVAGETGRLPPGVDEKTIDDFVNRFEQGRRRIAPEARLAGMLKEAGAEGDDDKTTGVLIQYLVSRYNADDEDVVGNRAREMGRRVIPAVCRALSEPPTANEPGQTKLRRDATLLILKASCLGARVKDVLSDNASRLVGEPRPEVLQGLVAGLEDARLREGALEALQWLSYYHPDLAMPALVSALDAATDPERRGVLQMAITTVCVGHIDRTIQGCLNHTAAHPDDNTLPKYLFEGNVAAVKRAGDAGKVAVARVARNVPRLRAGESRSLVQVLLTKFGASTTDLTWDVVEQARNDPELARTLDRWKKALSRVDVGSDNFKQTLSKLRSIDFQIDQQESLLGRTVFNVAGPDGRRVDPFVPGQRELREEAILGADFTITQRLQKLDRARTALVDEFVTRLELAAIEFLSLEDRELVVVKHQLLSLPTYQALKAPPRK